MFRGGLGKDLADYHDATQPVTVKLGNGPGDGRSADFDDITDAEHVIGSRFGDGLAAPPAGGRDTVDCGTGTPDVALVSIVGERSISGCERIVPISPPAGVTRPVS